MYCRWLAASACQAEFLQLVEDGNKRNPDCSILSHLYMACEDFLLSHWVEFLTSTFNPKHVSLHFDGVRISDVPGVTVEEVCRRSEAFLEANAGFKVRIREKHHHLVLPLIRSSAGSRGGPTFTEGHTLLKPGNCILHKAFSHYWGSRNEWGSQLLGRFCPLSTSSSSAATAMFPVMMPSRCKLQLQTQPSL